MAGGISGIDAASPGDDLGLYEQMVPGLGRREEGGMPSQLLCRLKSEDFINFFVPFVCSMHAKED